MTNNLLWSPDNFNNLLTSFTNYLKNKNYLDSSDYNSLHNWSIQNKRNFWSEIWNFTSIIGEFKEPIIENESDFMKSVFFKNSKLNFTQNLIQKKDDSDALVFYSEQGFKRRISWNELDKQVSKIACYFKKQKIKKGDRIVAILPNIPETVISFLGAAKIGAIWSSCSADFGPKAVIDRFKQIDPKILIISDYYYYNNKKIYTLDKIEEIKKKIPGLNQIIIIPYENKIINYEVNFEYKNWIKILENSSLFQIMKILNLIFLFIFCTQVVQPENQNA